MIMAAPFPNGCPQLEHNFFPLTDLQGRDRQLQNMLLLKSKQFRPFDREGEREAQSSSVGAVLGTSSLFPRVSYWEYCCTQGFLLQWYMSWDGWVENEAENDDAEMKCVPSLCVGCLWCSTCLVLEAACLQVVWMSCGSCHYQWDQSWKWTATCNMMMTHSYSDSIGCQSQTRTNQSQMKLNIWNLLRNIWAKPEFTSFFKFSVICDCCVWFFMWWKISWKMQVQDATCWSNRLTEDPLITTVKASLVTLLLFLKCEFTAKMKCKCILSNLN